MALVVIAFLSLSGMMNALLADLPRLSDNVWLLSLMYTALIFVFIAILECAQPRRCHNMATRTLAIA
jgi:hypothetical protein